MAEDNAAIQSQKFILQSRCCVFTLRSGSLFLLLLQMSMAHPASRRNDSECRVREVYVELSVQPH
jgi:hypothetical protein